MSTGSTASRCLPRRSRFHWTDLAATRFIAVRWLVLFTAGDLQAAGLELWDTGVAPHFDVVHADLGELVARMLGTPHRVVPNPHHEAGG